MSLLYIHILDHPKAASFEPLQTRCLHSTSGNHLLAQVVLVVTDRALPVLDGSVFAYKNLLGNLVEQSMGMLVIWSCHKT